MNAKVDRRYQPDWLYEQIDRQFQENELLKSNKGSKEIYQLLSDVENILEDEEFMSRLMGYGEEGELKKTYSYYLKLIERLEKILNKGVLESGGENEKKLQELLNTIYETIQNSEFIKSNFESLSKIKEQESEFVDLLKSRLDLVMDENTNKVNKDITSSFELYWDNLENMDLDFGIFVERLIEENENSNIELGGFLDMEDEEDSREKVKTLIQLAENYKNNLNVSIIATRDEIKDIGFTNEDVDYFSSLNNFNFSSLDFNDEDFNELDY